MNLFAVSFFGHRKVDDPFVTERQLDSIIRELLLTKEYVEFLVGRDGKFDPLVSSTVFFYFFSKHISLQSFVDKVIVKPKCPRNVTAAKKFHRKSG